MDWARSAKEELQRKANMALGGLHERDRFMLLKSLLKKMRESQNQHSKGEETPFVESKKEEK